MAATSKSEARSRARRARSVPPPRLPVLDQRQLDLIGLGLVARRVFLAFLALRRLAGRPRGRGARRRRSRWLVGGVRYVAPVALFAAAGAILVLRPVLPAVRPFRVGRASACSPR